MDFTKQHIKTSVVACIIDSQERVLLTQRCIEPFCNQWVMPGGKIDHGEPILEALHREVREEVGLEIQIDRLIDVYEHVGIGQGKDHYVILYYRAHPRSLNLEINPGEVTRAAWVTPEQFSGISMTPGTRHILAQVFPGRLVDPGVPEDELASMARCEILGNDS
jgi:8-oxo-dGTP diphosphatase